MSIYKEEMRSKESPGTSTFRCQSDDTLAETTKKVTIRLVENLENDFFKFREY